MPERLRVTFAASTAAELLVSVAAVADPDWRDTFAGAAEDVRAAGRPLLRRVGAFGRYAFLNLLGVLPETREPHTNASLLQWLRRTPPPVVHAVLVGARRRQLRELLPETVVTAALAGEPSARRELREVFASGRTVLTTTRWLLTTQSDDVRDELLDVLDTWRRLRMPSPQERTLRVTLAASVETERRAAHGRPAVDVIASVAGGLTYDPPSPPRTVLMLPAPSVRPIVVVVDDVRTHVIAYAPPAPVEPHERLLDLARALGDETRLRILGMLRDGERTMRDLATAFDVPRTTLLHHLAMLRAAGLLTTTVGWNNTTFYALRPEALGELYDAAVTVLQ